VEEKKKVLIVGNYDENALLALRIAEIKSQNPNITIVTLDEAKEQGLSETFEITNTLQPLVQVTLKDTYDSDNFIKSARNKRREDARKTKKNKSILK